jgi:hypothetical protein
MKSLASEALTPAAERNDPAARVPVLLSELKMDGVGAGAAVEHVVAGAGVEDVVQGVAGEVGGAGGEDAAVLDVGGEGVGGQVAVDGSVPPVLAWRWSR